MNQPPSSTRPSAATDTDDRLAPGGFIDRIYREALALLVETRNYFAYQEPKDVVGLPNDARLLVSQETMRITCRLTQVMAWLFCQKAVQNGERPADWALQDEHRLSGHSVCLDTAWQGDVRLPRGVRDLQVRTTALYHRIDRLDAAMRNPGPRRPGGPAVLTIAR